MSWNQLSWPSQNEWTNTKEGINTKATHESNKYKMITVIICSQIKEKEAMRADPQDCYAVVDLLG